MTPAPSATAKPREEWISWIRAVAILGVASIHNAGTTAAQANPWATRSGTFAVLVDMPFVVMVPLFLMVAGGLGLDPAKFTTPLAYYRKRAARLLVPLVVWNLVYIAYDWVYSPHFSHQPERILAAVLLGRVAPHLYFFWIIIGLNAISPLLVRWIAATGRREWIIAGAALTALPAIETGMARLMNLPPYPTNAWSWWFPFLGIYILGWALRGVRLRGWATAVVGLVGVAVLAVAVATWRSSRFPPLVTDWFRINYYALSTVIASCAFYLVAQAVVRPADPAAKPSLVSRAVNEISAATMGIYGLHVVVFYLLNEAGIFSSGPLSASMLVARYLLGMTITLAVIAVLRRIPYLRVVT